MLTGDWTGGEAGGWTGGEAGGWTGGEADGWTGGQQVIKQVIKHVLTSLDMVLNHSDFAAFVVGYQESIANDGQGHLRGFIGISRIINLGFTTVLLHTLNPLIPPSFVQMSEQTDFTQSLSSRFFSAAEGIEPTTRLVSRRFHWAPKPRGSLRS